MLSGRFAQFMEMLSITLIVLGIISLCQPFSFLLYQKGFTLLVFGWIGLNIWIHRRPVRSKIAEGNPQITIDGHPPIEVIMGERHSAK